MNFALPIVDTLASWPAHATWGEWLDRFGELAPRVLRRPERVLRVLGELRADERHRPRVARRSARRPGGAPADARRAAAGDRYGRVFVGSPQQARGRSFRVVFVPGLAERMFPQKLREDPMLLDQEMRAAARRAAGRCRTIARRPSACCCAGGRRATERLWLSYPRLESAGARPRVPSFYALDIMRAITGRIPHHEELQRRGRGRRRRKARLAGARGPSDAIDELEHDLATLRALLDAPDRGVRRGQAHYLLGLNACAAPIGDVDAGRAARSRWLPHDGLMRVTGNQADARHAAARGPAVFAVGACRGSRRARISSCCLRSIASPPLDQPEPLQRLDPLTRGVALPRGPGRVLPRAAGAASCCRSPPTACRTRCSSSTRQLDTTAAEYTEKLAPAIDRVWRDEIAAIGRDLRVWVRKLPEAAPWTPAYFEFSFGLATRDAIRAQSAPSPCGSTTASCCADRSISSRRNRGWQDTAGHRSQDGQEPDDAGRLVIGGGAMLQPVLYGLAVETDRSASRSATGRLFYCTAAGGFTEHAIPLNEADPPRGPRGARDHRPRDRARLLPAAPVRARVHVVRLPAGLRPGRAAARSRKAADLLADLDGAAGDAMTASRRLL